jgi:hypothetical protein
MIICSDFDGTVVRADRPYEDVTSPLQFQHGAREALLSLKAAGHTLVLFSARTNRALLYTPDWDPLVRAGIRKPDLVRWHKERPLHWARYFQMLEFVQRYLPRVFDVVDDGLQGKPTADLFIDDRALRYGYGSDAVGWQQIQTLYGERPTLVQPARSANVRR